MFNLDDLVHYADQLWRVEALPEPGTLVIRQHGPRYPSKQTVAATRVRAVTPAEDRQARPARFKS